MKTVVDGLIREHADSGSALWFEPLVGLSDGLDLDRTHVIAIAIPLSGAEADGVRFSVVERLSGAWSMIG